MPPRVKIKILLPVWFSANDKKITNTRKFNNASPIPANIDIPEFIEMKLKNEQPIVKQNRIVATKTGFFILSIKFLFIIYL